MTEAIKLKAKDYKSEVKPIWCPGCGHFSVLNAITKAMAGLGIDKDNTVLVSGIGCSSLPYFNCCCRLCFSFAVVSFHITRGRFN